MSQNNRNQGFSYYFCLMIEGSGSLPLTNGSGRSRNIRIRLPKWRRFMRIRIRNTGHNVLLTWLVLPSWMSLARMSSTRLKTSSLVGPCCCCSRLFSCSFFLLPLVFEMNTAGSPVVIITWPLVYYYHVIWRAIRRYKNAQLSIKGESHWLNMELDLPSDSNRVTESWNKIPSHVKIVETVSGFKRSYKNTESWLLLPSGKKIWRQDWRMKHNLEEDTPREVPAGLLGVQHQEKEQVYLGSMCRAVLIGWDPATPLLPPHLGAYTRALLVSQERQPSLPQKVAYSPEFTWFWQDIRTHAHWPRSGTRFLVTPYPDPRTQLNSLPIRIRTQNTDFDKRY